jgi:D-alanyl-D-alanine carboxypeptidase
VTARAARERRARSTGTALLGVALLLVLSMSACSLPSADAAHARRNSSSRPKSERSTPSSGSTDEATADPTPDPTADPTAEATATPHPLSTDATADRAVPTAGVFDAALQSRDDPASSWVVVNKSRELHPVSYAPGDLVFPDVTYVNRQPMREPTARALVALFRAGKTEAGLDFSVQSAYRSFESQQRVYDDDIAQHGLAFADADTARPGHSEHQTGMAVDISAVPARCSLDACFATTPQGQWLAANAWRFGFLLRYPADKVAVTGFTFEPWHFRYVGVPLSTRMHTIGTTTLEEFFGLPGGQVYP